MTRRLRVGVVGAGHIAQVAQLPALSRTSDVSIEGVVTRTSESAAANLRRWPIANAYESLDAMLGAARLDALLVLTPRQLHGTHVRAGLEAGLDVFCEKPLADSTAEAEDLARLAEARQQLLMVGFNRRFAPCYRRVKESFGHDGPAVVVAQKNRRGSEYRATFENAIHMVDMMRFLCGEPASVDAHAVDGSDPYHEDALSALVRFESGAVGSLVAARNAGAWDERLDAYGDAQSTSVTAPYVSSVVRDDVVSRLDQVPAAYGWANVNEAFGFAASMDEFLHCVRSRRVPQSDGWSAARTQGLLDSILDAAGLPTTDAPDAAWSSRAQG